MTKLEMSSAIFKCFIIGLVLGQLIAGPKHGDQQPSKVRPSENDLIMSIMSVPSLFDSAEVVYAVKVVGSIPRPGAFLCGVCLLFLFLSGFSEPFSSQLQAACLSLWPCSKLAALPG